MLWLSIVILVLAIMNVIEILQIKQLNSELKIYKKRTYKRDGSECDWGKENNGY